MFGLMDSRYLRFFGRREKRGRGGERRREEKGKREGERGKRSPQGQGLVIAGMDTGIAWDVAALKTKYRGFDAKSGQVDHSHSWHDTVKSGGKIPIYDITPFPQK